ncbi:Abi family protein [Billgrantia endophytica]|uniref:Abi family protein n=1 Tax=Billgrantia endophytica TaxID=2033802 RepID=UPI00197A9611|nr:Abi family protein [Halomonas endophytica]
MRHGGCRRGSRPGIPGARRLLPQATDQFVPNTQFVDAVRLYLFDKELRLRLTDALERIEIALRVDIAHLLGERDAFAHLHRDTFHPSFARRKFGRDPRDNFEKWQERCEGMERRSKEDFVNHYRQKHGPRLPIWVAVETWDFGTLPWCDDFHDQPQLIARTFLLLSIARHMTKVVCPDTGWHQRLQAHLTNFPAPHTQRQLSLDDMGAPPGWERWWSA